MQKGAACPGSSCHIPFTPQISVSSPAIVKFSIAEYVATALHSVVVASIVQLPLAGGVPQSTTADNNDANTIEAALD